MTSPLGTRLGFVAAAALVAAGLGDPVVETISGTGVFGAGYADHNHLGAVPVLIAALTLLAAIFCIRCTATLRDALLGRSTSSSGATAASRGPSFAECVLVFSLQFGGVLWMEFVEATISGERLQPGLSWLGAPLPFALLMYAVVAVCAIAAVHRFLRSMSDACTRLVRVALEIVLSRAPLQPYKSLGELCEPHLCARHQTLLARNIGGRAPPLSLQPSAP